VRQTAAGSGRRVFVTAEDLRVWCVDAATGDVAWTSEQLEGQSARDYFPVLARAGDRTIVVVRTSPSSPMSERIARDRRALARSAGLDDGDWKTLDAWTKRDGARGGPELWAREEEAIGRLFDEEPGAQTFFLLDAATGRPAGRAPVLWCGGCQGVGSPPVVLPNGALQVLYRSAYGNWNHGIAPLVALGALDLATLHITQFAHTRGRQPPVEHFLGHGGREPELRRRRKNAPDRSPEHAGRFRPRLGRSLSDRRGTGRMGRPPAPALRPQRVERAGARRSRDRWGTDFLADR
jgi:hypothetical protein